MTTTIANEIKLTSRVANPISLSSSFDLDTITTWRNYNNESYDVKIHHLTFSVSVENTFTENNYCYKSWVVYYHSQNKNGTWRKQWSYIGADFATIDSLIGCENRIAIENQITNELVEKLQNALVAIELKK